MITFGIFVLLALVLAIILNDGWIEETVMLFTVFVAVAVAFTMLCSLSEGAKTVHETHQMENLADRVGMHGTFFLFGGNIDSQPVYAWYEEVAPNAYKQKHADAEEATIHYTQADERPHYVVTMKDYGGFFQKWCFQPSGNDIERYDFYVPKGSITNTYKLDAQ